jgi:hypothetical protein
MGASDPANPRIILHRHRSPTMRLRRLLPILAPLFALVVAPGVLADARIEFRQVEGDTPALGSILVGHGKVRVDSDRSNSVIFDPAAETIWVLDHAERRYSRMTRADLERIGASLGSAVSRLDDALASVPPEVRAQMQELIGGMLPGGAPGSGAPMVRMSETGRTLRVAGRSCRVFETVVMGEVVAETCLADPAVLDELGAAERRTLEQVMRMSEAWMEPLAKSPIGNAIDMGFFRDNRVPLRATDFEDGRRNTSEFAGISRGPIPADLFRAPAGYRDRPLEFAIE